MFIEERFGRLEYFAKRRDLKDCALRITFHGTDVNEDVRFLVRLWDREMENYVDLPLSFHDGKVISGPVVFYSGKLNLRPSKITFLENENAQFRLQTFEVIEKPPE